LLFKASAALEPWEDRRTGREIGEEGLCTGGGEYSGVTGSDVGADINSKPPGLGSCRRWFRSRIQSLSR